MGFSEAELDEAPTIVASEWFKQVSSADEYDFRVQLLTADGTEITSINLDGTTSTSDWFEVSHTFRDYGTGLRRIRIEDGGVDTAFWAGHYGVQLDDASVVLTAP